MRSGALPRPPTLEWKLLPVGAHTTTTVDVAPPAVVKGEGSGEALYEERRGAGTIEESWRTQLELSPRGLSSPATCSGRQHYRFSDDPHWSAAAGEGFRMVGRQGGGCISSVVRGASTPRATAARVGFSFHFFFSKCEQLVIPPTDTDHTDQGACRSGAGARYTG